MNKTRIENRKYFLKWLKEKIKEDWGKRCRDYEPACPVCCAWKQFDKLNHI